MIVLKKLGYVNVFFQKRNRFPQPPEKLACRNLDTGLNGKGNVILHRGERRERGVTIHLLWGLETCGKPILTGEKSLIIADAKSLVRSAGIGHANGVITPDSDPGPSPAVREMGSCLRRNDGENARQGDPSRFSISDGEMDNILGNSYDYPSASSAVMGTLFISPIDFPTKSELARDSSSQKCLPD